MAKMGITVQSAIDRLDNHRAKYDAGSTNPTMRLIIYDGVRPADVSVPVGAQVPLVQFDDTSGVQTPAFPAASDADPNATTAANNVPWSATGLATGTATWARAFDRDNNPVSDGDVGATSSGADFELSVVAITPGLPVTMQSWTLTDLEEQP